MPKARRTGTVASNTEDTHQATVGSGNSSRNAVLEMAQRLADRLQQASSIDVSSYSSSRRQQEILRVEFDSEDIGRARVLSGDRSYSVDYENNTCNCIHHRVRNARCRHIDAVHQALGQVRDTTSFNTPVGQSADLSETDEQLTRIDNIDEANRQALEGLEEDDGFFYSDENNQEAFERLLVEAQQEELPYEYENVLNGSRNTFGIELEFVGGNADAIARELYQLGICSHDRRLPYHSTGVSGKWRLERDGSVSSGSSGGELVSPVLTDTPETWRAIEKICEVAKRHGASINQQCGGHIHVGIEPLNTARQRWKRFFRTIGGFEEVLYRLAGGDLGQIRSNSSHYARPFQQNARSTTVSRFSLENRNDIDNLARRASNHNRYYGINLTNIYQSNKPNTVEFRYFNGSLNPAQIQANVKVANGVIIAAQKARTRGSVSETTKRRGQILRETPMERRRDESLARSFVDIIFSRKKDKDAILKVFGKNRWAF